MYLILNKENDYKTNRSKIEALELQYKGLTKLISTEEGQLNKTMLQNIKEKQDLTYNTLVSFYNQMTSIYASHGVDTNIDYDPIDTNAIFVEQKLLTYIMENENEFVNRSNNLINDMYKLIKNKISVTARFPYAIQIVEKKLHPLSNHFVTFTEIYDDFMPTISSIAYLNFKNFKTNGKQQTLLLTWASQNEGNARNINITWLDNYNVQLSFELNSGKKIFNATLDTNLLGELDLTFKENLKLNQISNFDLNLVVPN